MSEIQEAAKRVLSWAEDRCMLNPMSPMEIENKICAVAEAYLAEHPACHATATMAAIVTPCRSLAETSAS